MAPTGQQYKIKLSSGRILGPIDLERVRLLILKNHVVGVEVAREHPDGDWRDINLFPELAELLVAKAAGTLKKEQDEAGYGGYRPIQGGKIVNSEPGSTQVLPGATEVLPTEETANSLQLDMGNEPVMSEPLAGGDEDEGKTMVAPLEERTSVEIASRASLSVPQLDRGEVAEGGNDQDIVQQPVMLDSSKVGIDSEVSMQIAPHMRNIAQEKTVMFQRSTDTSSASSQKKAKSPKELLKLLVVVVAVAVAAQELFFGEEQEVEQQTKKWTAVRPQLPSFVQGKSDPKESEKYYLDGMRLYLADTVTGYKAAAESFHKAAGRDASNVKALALLASSYLNLIDSSNKDENYFSVISKLIDMSRAKAVDLPETVIADVEFYVTVGKAEAAQNRVVEYTKTHQGFGLEMFFYLSYAFYYRGDLQSAARFISQIPDNKVYSARIFYLRGQIAEGLGDSEAALREFDRAVAFNKDHARSRLRIADILAQKGKLQEAGPHLEYVVSKPALLAPKEMARAYFLHAQLNSLFSKWDLALGDIERAVKLDKDNHDYLLELYTLRAKAGDSVKSVQKEARMYYFLGEGEKARKDSRHQDALNNFLQARQANLDSPLPLVKIGDMFFQLNDMENARLNYKLASARAANNVQIWSKYLNTLILSYDWEEAQKAIDRFKTMPMNQSTMDKASGDMYARQGRHTEAQMFYKKAMARDSIDSEVYIAFAKSLIATKNFKDAPFFFALARRFDPLNVDAVVGAAQATAAGEGLDAGITMLQDELQRGSGSRAEILAAIAEFYIQKAEWGPAQQYVDQAMSVNPNYAYPWKLQAQIYMAKEGIERNALDKALAAYKSYSDRNSSDPSGYLERYRVFLKKAQFEQASEELDRVYTLYPKYPNLFFYRGTLSSLMGNHKMAVEKFQLELKNNPSSVTTMVALGKELIEVGDAQGALNLFNQAMQLAPNTPDPKHYSGYANFLLKNYQGAIALYNSAIALDQGNPLIYKRLGQAHLAIGDVTGARTAFKKYLEMEPDAVDKAEFERYL